MVQTLHERSSTELPASRGPARFQCVSIFTGAGGLDLGLEAVGFQTRFASDIDLHSIETLRMGKAASRGRAVPFLSDTVIAPPMDLRGVAGASILAESGLRLGEVDLLVGGPPCQAFSVFGKRRGRDDPRGMLAFEYLRLLGELRPTAFVLENVAGMLTIEQGSVFEDLIAQLSNPARGLHYRISVLRMDAVNYGVPQFRDRVFIIGDIEGRAVPTAPAICSSESSTLFDELKPWRTVRDAFRDLPDIGAAFPRNHVGRVHSERIVTRYAGLRPGERDHFTRINKLDLDRPSFTIIVGSDKGGGKGHVHPVLPREVTPRESARIQTFPDWWAFSGTSRHPIRQVGNAVPPLLAAAVGNALRQSIFAETPVPLASVLAALSQEHLFPDPR